MWRVRVRGPERQGQGQGQTVPGRFAGLDPSFCVGCWLQNAAARGLDGGQWEWGWRSVRHHKGGLKATLLKALTLGGSIRGRELDPLVPHITIATVEYYQY